ncbi:MAG TPA: hypothetical protein VHV30_07975 [Polyangiaceae bacterium]|nr:hypothetical protein [Polyangiaceae bacterium]
MRARSRIRRPLAALLPAFFAAASLGCGEDVDFASGARDAGLGPVDASAADAVPDVTEEPSPIDSGPPPADARDDGRGLPCASQCNANGSACRTARDCCSGRCDDDYCLPLNACDAPGTPCTSRSTCCSGRCEPLGRNGAVVCGAYCEADHEACEQASDCCSLACNSGVCGGALCAVVGGACDRDSGCCSNRCEGGRCAAEPTACLPTGEACGTDAGAGFGVGPMMGPGGSASPCCSGVCDPTTQRCDLGPGSCREPSVPCSMASECCRIGTCEPNADGIRVCTAPCVADGQTCNSDGDCCNGSCSGLGQCESPQQQFVCP